MARIVVCGYMIRYPLAGNLLAYFHYVLGLHRLGHEVLYIEESGWPRSCYDPVIGDWQDDPRTGLRVVRGLLADCGVQVPVCYVNRDSGQVEGTSWEDVRRMLGEADLLLNIGGVCWLPEFRLCRRRALVDMDPFFTQVGRFGPDPLDWCTSDDYHVLFTYGANIGHSGCTIPTRGVDWVATVPPVALDLWNCTQAGAGSPFTTIANWNPYPDESYQGEHYGHKDQEFLRMIDLPSRTAQRLELAISGASVEVRQQLQVAGWSVRDAGEEVSTDFRTYLAYIMGSRGEWSVAKHAYVKTHSGWFSDRSVCYLASGRPVILQDTGFSDWLPTGRGVLAFTSLEEATQCIEQVNADYLAHCRAAREIAEQTFNYKKVLRRLIEIGMGHETTRTDIGGLSR